MFLSLIKIVFKAANNKVSSSYVDKNNIYNLVIRQYYNIIDHKLMLDSFKYLILNHVILIIPIYLQIALNY